MQSSRQFLRSAGCAATRFAAPRASMGTFAVPKVNNEPNQHYAPGSKDRKGLQQALEEWGGRGSIDIPLIIAGKEVYTESEPILEQFNPSDHAKCVARAASASTEDISAAITTALAAKPAWESLPFADRAAIFLKAADLIAGEFRYDIMALTMLGQGKNAWQAEIDAAAELCDFLRFNVTYAQQLYAQQPVHHAPGVWNRLEYRPLEGFVYAVSPFNFTAIGGNLPAAPALMGNVVIWKPSPHALLSNSLLEKIFNKAGLPPGVIQFLPGDAEKVTSTVLSHPEFAALHYTGSTAVFRALYGRIGAEIAAGTYRGYPRVVGETGGKNFHILHHSAHRRDAALHTVRGAFEYAGQKCSATSRVYVPRSAWPLFKLHLVEMTEGLKQGPPQDFENFLGPVIHRASFDKLSAVIEAAKADPGVELVAGGRVDGSKGYFVRPTIYRVDDPLHPLMTTELFGPILAVHVYDDGSAARGDALAKEAAFDAACALAATSSTYALTGSVFARDRAAIRRAEELLRHAAGNFYVNCKSTGAVVGQQPFGGARASGTNDKAGSPALLSRFVSMRSLKEEFEAPGGLGYLSNEVGGV